VVDNRDSTQSRFFFYDDLDRLWKSTNLSGTPLFTYTYDANGNRTQQIAPGGTTNYSYASSTDRIAQATGAAAKHYAHDAFGSRIWAGPTAYAGQPSHVYDEGNRLVEVREPVSQAVLGQYTYDAAGRRVRKVAGGVTTLYFYDAAGHLVGSQNLSTSPATRRTYVFVEDEPMGLVDQPPSGPPVFSWIHTDRLGTPLAVTSTPASGSAKTIWRASYEPFGLATPDEDPDGDSQAFALDLRFPGQVFDAESGDHYNLNRTYEPATGSYLSADPIGLRGGFNVYIYANGNALRWIDPSGLYWDNFARGLMDLVAGRRDMMDAGTEDADTYFHCRANCEASRRGIGGYDAAVVGSLFREMIQNESQADRQRDERANEDGQCAGRGNPGADCYEACAHLIPSWGIPRRHLPPNADPSHIYRPGR
jgi:RHS repeat-associated protein